MKLKLIAVVAVLAAAAAAKDAGVAVPAANLQATASLEAAKGSQDAGDSSDTYAARMADYKADRSSLTNDIAGYQADHDTATNKISQVTDAPTKQALNKTLNVVEDCQHEIQDLKQMVADLKRALAAHVGGK